MKKAIRLSIILAAFAGVFTFPSSNYAGTLAFSPTLGIRPRVIQKIKDRLELQAPALFFKRKEKRPDPYAQAWKAARVLATSA